MEKREKAEASAEERAQKTRKIQSAVHIGLTCSRKKLRDLIYRRHVLNSCINFLSYLQNSRLPFYVTVSSVQKPVCNDNKLTL